MAINYFGPVHAVLPGMVEQERHRERVVDGRTVAFGTGAPASKALELFTERCTDPGGTGVHAHLVVPVNG
jgi:hypothetical protein